MELSPEQIEQRNRAVEERRAEREAIKRDLENGMVLGDVYKKYHVDHTALRKLFSGRIPRAKGTTKKELQRIQRDEQTVNMYADSLRGMTMQDIGKKYGLTPTTVSRRIADIRVDLTPAAVQVYRQQEFSKLNLLEQKLWGMIDDDYFVVNHGKVIIHPETGQPMKDSAPVLSAADRILKIMERRAKLGGFDAQEKITVEHNISEIQVTEVKDLVEKAREEMRLQEQALQARAIEAGAVDAEIVNEAGAVDAEIVNEADSSN
jgi:DNA-binding Lrp family transcriptional regulator